MLLHWIESVNLLRNEPTSGVLSMYSVEGRRTLVRVVTSELVVPTLKTWAAQRKAGVIAGDDDGADPETGLGKLPTPSHVRWNLECLGAAFALPLDESGDLHLVEQALRLYAAWSGVAPGPRLECMSVVPRGRGGRSSNGSKVNKHGQELLRMMFGHLSLLFEYRRNGGDGVLFTRHRALCAAALNVLDRVSISHAGTMSPRTWNRLLRVLLGICDYCLVHVPEPTKTASLSGGDPEVSQQRGMTWRAKMGETPPKAKVAKGASAAAHLQAPRHRLGLELCEQLVRVLLSAWLRSGTQVCARLVLCVTPASVCHPG